jgi:hypothetical protein
MKSKQILFFSILDDSKPIFESVETSVSLHYFKMGLLDFVDIPNYRSIFDVPNLGFVMSGDWNRVDNYLVMLKETQLSIREVAQRAGGVKFAVDQMQNSKSIELKPGGIYKDKENVIVAGRIATISEDEISNYIFKIFSSRIMKEFKKVGAFYVGQKAEEKLNLGWRLVTNEKSPKEFDLAKK